MADLNFVVRNGLTVNNALVANSSAVVINIGGSGGTNGQVLASNGSGGLYWANGFGSSNVTFSGNVSIVGLLANNSLGSNGQLLTSNGSGIYWSNAAFDVNAQYTWTNTHIFSNTVTFNNTVFLNALSANGSLGIAGQVLTSNGSDTYWSNVSGGSGTSINLTANNSDSATYYFPMSNISSGTWSNGVVSDTQLYFVPSTGTLSATVFNSLSDITLKTDIEDINGIELLNNIRPISFVWKDTGTKSYGVIAQELEKELPELVQTNEQGLKSVSYIPMIAMLIDTVKKQEKRIEQLEKRLDAK